MAITRVQQTGKTQASATAVSLAYSSNVTAGNLLIIGAIKYSPTDDAFVVGDFSKTAGTATLGTATLDKSNNYNFDAGATRIAVGIWSVPVTGTGSCTVQVGGGIAGSEWVFGISERSGLDTGASRVDGTPTSNQAQTGAPSPGSITSTGDALFVGAVAIGSSALITITENASYSLIYEEQNGATSMTGSVIDRIITGAATDNPSWSAPTTEKWAAAGVAYKAASSGLSAAVLSANHYRRRRIS